MATDVDGLLKGMTETGARGLRLAVGSPARMLDAAGTAQDATSTPLSRQEILALIIPIIPEHARRRLPQESTVEFDYVSAEAGSFKVTVLRSGTDALIIWAGKPSAKRAASTLPSRYLAARPGR